jgi:hypothetical protein
MNEARIDGYSAMLERVRAGLSAAYASEQERLRTQPRQPIGRVWEGAGGLELADRPGGGSPVRKPDPFNLGDAPRGSRRH